MLLPKCTKSNTTKWDCVAISSLRPSLLTDRGEIRILQLLYGNSATSEFTQLCQGIQPGRETPRLYSVYSKTSPDPATCTQYMSASSFSFTKRVGHIVISCGGNGDSGHDETWEKSVSVPLGKIGKTPLSGRTALILIKEHIVAFCSFNSGSVHVVLLFRFAETLNWSLDQVHPVWLFPTAQALAAAARYLTLIAH